MRIVGKAWLAQPGVFEPGSADTPFDPGIRPQHFRQFNGQHLLERLFTEELLVAIFAPIQSKGRLTTFLHALGKLVSGSICIMGT